jgi:L-fucose mutarotase
MLKYRLLHPHILAACARAGHGSKVLISDGNYPHSTQKGDRAELVYLNLSPGKVTVTDVLQALVTAVPIESAEVMDYARTGPYALKEDPPVWNEFRTILRENGYSFDLQKLERFAFYEAAGGSDMCLTVATGEERIYANLLLTIGVVKPAAG